MMFNNRRKSPRTLRRCAAVAALLVALVGVQSSTAGAQSSNIDANGSLTAMIDKIPNTLDPARALGASAWPYVFELYDRLVGRDDDNNLKPMLATKWAFSSDGRTFTMELRRDVRFNDGTPLTSADVKATIERDKTLPGSSWAVTFAPVASIDTPTPYQVRFNLSRPAGNLPGVLTSPAGAIISAKAIRSGRNLGTNPGSGAGSGPVVVKRYIVNNRVDFVRADNDYWDKTKNRLAKVQIIAVPDATARLNALRSGQADLIKITYETSSQAKALGKQAFVYREKPGAGQIAVYFNSRRSPLTSLALRQAMNYAIDREAIEKAFGGDCQAATQLFPKGQIGNASYLENQYNYDPARARRLLTQGGFQDGVSVGLSFPTTSPYDVIAQIVQEQLGKVGIRANVRGSDGATSTAQFAAGGIDMNVGNMVTQLDPSQLIDSYFLTSQSLAIGVAPEIATLQAAGLDRTQPAKVWQQKYKDIAGAAGGKSLYMPICNVKAQYLTTKKVGGLDKMAGQKDSAGLEARDLWMTR